MAELKDFTKEEIVKHLEGLDDKFTVRTPTQDAEYSEKIVNEAVGSKLKEIATKVETAVTDATGFEKQHGERYDELLTRALKGSTEKTNELTTALEKIKTEGLKGNKAAEEVQKQLDAFKEAKEKEVAELQSRVEGFQGSIFKGKVDNLVNEAMSRLRPSLRDDLDSEILENAVSNVVNNWKSEVKPVDHEGTIIFHDADGKPIIDNHDGNHLSAYAMLQKKLTPFIDKNRVVTGNNSKPPAGSGGADGAKKMTLPSDVKNQIQLLEFLKKDTKLQPSSKEFTEIFQANKEGLPLR
jgi:hypothetical protein